MNSTIRQFENAVKLLISGVHEELPDVDEDLIRKAIREALQRIRAALKEEHDDFAQLG